MAEKYQENAKIISQNELAPGIFSIWFETAKIAEIARAGQFIVVYMKDVSRMLPRPISICEIDAKAGAIRIVYRVTGEGTKELSQAKSGECYRIMGPLGNGYDKLSGKVMVIGGGIGIPPMLGLAESLEGDVTAVLGYRDAQFLRSEFEKNATVYIATEDGSDGTKGNVLDAINQHGLCADVICACGPTPMLRAIKDYAIQNDIACYVSLEEKMACGIGACLACVCKSKEVDEHSNVHNKRICKEGPVFDAREVVF